MAKGQWFIVSAVIASTTFLTLSILLRGYFNLDITQTANMDEDYVMENAITGINNVYRISQSDTALNENFLYLKYFFIQKAVERGYLLEITNTSAMSLSGTQITIKVATDKMSITRNMTIRK